MKKLLFLCLATALLSGCVSSLIPKKVEYFQRKVQAVPEMPEKAREHQRQAAQYVAVKTEQVEKAAIATKADPAVLVPAAEASGAAQALTESMGPPAEAWSSAFTNLVETLHKDQAKLNSKVEDYREAVQKDVGKKIEGTGFFQLGYFTNAFFLVGGLFVLGSAVWIGLKIYGVANPAVALGTNAVGSVASSVLSRGLSEIVAGGERFKTYLENSTLPADAVKYVQDLFTRAHMEAQSQDVQAIVTDLTRQEAPTAPSSTPVPPPVALSTPAAPASPAPAQAAPVAVPVAIPADAQRISGSPTA